MDVPGTAVWLAPAAMDPARRRAFTDLIPYCLPPGTDYQVSPGPKPIVSYTVSHAEETRRIDRLLTEAFARSAGAAGRVSILVDRWTSADAAAAPAMDVRDVGPGLFVGGPGMVVLLRALDRVFRDVATAAGATEYAVPALVGWQTLQRAGYPSNFPQHLLACATVGPDLDALDRFAAAGDLDDRSKDLHAADVCLAPAVCLHLFARFAGESVTGSRVATALGSCGRYEAGARTSPTRLWSYRMREIVFIGDAGAALRFRDDMIESLTGLIDALGLPGRIVTANDPFFTSAATVRADYQSRFDVKYELCGRLAGDGSGLAVASLNVHQQHFGLGFDITLADGSPAHSVCLGFGLERWAHWVHGHLGDDPAHWPPRLREARQAGRRGCGGDDSRRSPPIRRQ